ncbi:multidrug efflux MFS transporter [Lysinibacillus agricola]|uniref:Multidrug efflux MFS transporter n=1 Tax=Lysinibacillus agricola TaxID=2590012 RepID=A0ABX7ALH8_9BACI|nr:MULTISPECIES: DHA2 family efflux MFS transporter permease subunit [Lysinibacillus]KOS59836.1 multidrug MFS transporter [Lysinibacillus sp. FJAT-14222]QQP10615.1 multidrug efflux MFS transporter [Lysinibacillus agricola]
MSLTVETQQTKVIKTTPILISFLIAGFIGLFSETALNMALGDLIQVFSISSSTVQWLTTGYLLTLGILVPVSGLLLQWFSTRQIFIVSLIFSIIGTLVAALAPSFEVLMFSRVIQAIGTGLLLPLMFNSILLIFPVNKRGATMGLIGLVIMFAPAVGPSISGLILEKLTWHWIFWVCLPFLILALISGIVYMQNVSTITKPKIDLLSIILSTIGFGGIVYGFSSAGENGWGSTIVITMIIIGLAALTLFSLRQLKMDKPMLDLRVLKYPMFTLGLLAVFICFTVIMSTMILLPLYLQTGLALTAFTAGLVLLPGGVLNGLMSPITGRIFDKFGPRGLVIPGFAIMPIMLWIMSNVTIETPVSMVIVMHSILFLGVSMVLMPAQTNGLNQLPKNLYPDGTALMNTLQQMSGAIGTAVAITIMSASQKRYMNNMTDLSDPSSIRASLTAGVQDSFIFTLIIAMVGLIISFFIKSSRVK